jgi:SAM-dependent methyltransferase
MIRLYDLPMAEYGPETYGEHIADVYDDWYRNLGDAEEQADLLAELANGGRALELGIGTGRIALPLAARGVEVHGIDTSPAMVAKMRAKPGGDAISTTIGDMADVAVEGTFSLAFVVFNTFFMLTTQEAQVRCFRNVAAHLAPGGRFVLGAFVPDLSRIERGNNVTVGDIGVSALRLDATQFDSLTQRIDVVQMRITEQGTRLVHAKMRYAFVPELDLMAQLAGLTLEHRWSSFDKQRFTNESAYALSVYRA